MSAPSIAHTHHAIDYIEITVSDLAAAKTFYEEAFGWTFNDYGPAYAGIRGEGREMGGLREERADGGAPQGTSTHAPPLVVLYSRDLDASVAAVKDAGGTITKEPFSFPGGRRFHFRDPSTNELAVWSEQ